MKQIVQDARSGRVAVAEVPAPTFGRRQVLVRTAASVVSAGTERDVLTFARKSLLGKALDRPDLARQVVEKLRQEGIGETYRAVMARLDHPTPLGYSLAGAVIAVGAEVEGLAPGERVACGGAGQAVHAEIVSVGKNLCVRVPSRPDGGPISHEEAAFATLGAIALQGVRLVQPTLGERVVVIGLGVIGQLACQLLRAHGCEVFAVDPDSRRVYLARELGAEGGGDPATSRESIDAFTRGRAADAVVIAAATPSNEPVELAAEISRRKGRVVIVGNVGMQIPRRPYYERELTVTVSCSYGPGRYDPLYEENGVDYPIAYVRWTEQRNMEAFLDALASGRVQVAPLISHRLPLDRAQEAFELIGQSPAEPSLGIVLSFPQGTAEAPLRRSITIRPRAMEERGGEIAVGAVGAGTFARTVMFPQLRRVTGVRLRAVAAATGTSATSAARRYGFDLASTASDDVLAAPDVDVVFVLTRHSLHAAHVLAALRAGKHVFVEKPLCITREELAQIASVYGSLAADGLTPVLMIGFNRRFSPLARRIRDEATGGGPLLMHYRVNAGPLPAEHWLRDPQEGGRIVGEACHFVDLAAYLTGSHPRRVFAMAHGAAAEPTTVLVELADGSVLDLVYTQDGPRRMGKERLEVFQGSRSWVLDDWRSLTSFAERTARRAGGWMQQKGYEGELAAFFDAVRGSGPLPIPFESIVSTTMTCFSALESLRAGAPVEMPDV